MFSPKGDVNGGTIIFYCYGIYASDFDCFCRFILSKITHTNNSSCMQSLNRNQIFQKIKNKIKRKTLDNTAQWTHIFYNSNKIFMAEKQV